MRIRKKDSDEEEEEKEEKQGDHLSGSRSTSGGSEIRLASVKRLF